VSGHWRKQFYPRENIRKPRYIHSYLKGDPTKRATPTQVADLPRQKVGHQIIAEDRNRRRQTDARPGYRR